MISSTVAPRHPAVWLGALLLLAGAPLLAQDRFPDLDAGATGKGTYANRGSGESWSIERATVRLRAAGEVRIHLEGKQLDLVVEGRMKSWNGRQHVDFELTRFDDRASDAFGWVKLDAHGGFERIEMSGKTPVRLSVDFFSEKSFPVAPERPSPPPAPERPGPEDHGSDSRFTEDWGYDRPGNDLFVVPASRVDECQSSCWRESRCAAYAFNQSTRKCYLKGAPGAPLPRRDIVSGVRRAGSGSGSGSGQGAYGLTEMPGQDQPGNDYVDFRARDLRDCQRSCADDPRCLAYTFNMRSAQCYLKSRSGATRPRNDTVTGVKPPR